MSGAGFAKLFSSIVHSSVWSENDAVRVVWVTLLALADREGVVEASVPGLARAANVSRERLEDALAVLLTPDPDDRSGVNEGRRIEAVRGGWKITNYLAYRDRGRNAERRDYFRERKRKQRAAAGVSTLSTNVNTIPPNVEVEAEAEVGKNREAKLAPTLPGALATGEFRTAWADWLAYRRERKLSRWKPRTVAAKLDELATVGADRAVAAIRRSIANGWSGIFPESDRREKGRRASAVSASAHSPEELASLERRIRRSEAS